MKINKKIEILLTFLLFSFSIFIGYYYDHEKFSKAYFLNMFKLISVHSFLMFIFALTMITIFKTLCYFYLKKSKRPDRGTIRLIFLISFLTCIVIILSAVFSGYMDKFVDKLFKLVDRLLVWI